MCAQSLRSKLIKLHKNELDFDGYEKRVDLASLDRRGACSETAPCHFPPTPQLLARFSHNVALPPESDIPRRAERTSIRLDSQGGSI